MVGILRIVCVICGDGHSEFVDEIILEWRLGSAEDSGVDLEL